MAIQLSAEACPLTPPTAGIYAVRNDGPIDALIYTGLDLDTPNYYRLTAIVRPHRIAVFIVDNHGDDPRIHGRATPVQHRERLANPSTRVAVRPATIADVRQAFRFQSGYGGGVYRIAWNGRALESYAHIVREIPVMGPLREPARGVSSAQPIRDRDWGSDRDSDSDSDSVLVTLYRADRQWRTYEVPA